MADELGTRSDLGRRRRAGGLAVPLWLMLGGAPRLFRLASMAYPLGQLAVVVFALTSAYAYGLGGAALALVGACGLACAPFDAVMFRRVAVAAHAEERVGRSRALDDQLAAQRAHHERYRAEIDGAEGLYEELAADLGDVREALRAGDEARAAARLEELSGTARLSPGHPFCANLAVDALLAGKAQACRAQGVAPAFTADVPDDLPLPDAEVCAILGNLLDNALNACTGLPDVEVRLEVFVHAGVFSVRVENPCAPEADGTSRAPRRRARRLERHGWGLDIVDALARHHGGSFTHTREADRFVAEVTLLLSL